MQLTIEYLRALVKEQENRQKELAASLEEAQDIDRYFCGLEAVLSRIEKEERK